MRVKRWYCSVELLRTFLAPNNVIPQAYIVADGWPEDARVLEASVVSDGRMVRLIVESATFDEVSDVETAPYLNTTFDTKKPVHV